MAVPLIGLPDINEPFIPTNMPRSSLGGMFLGSAAVRAARADEPRPPLDDHGEEDQRWRDGQCGRRRLQAPVVLADAWIDVELWAVMSWKSLGYIPLLD